MGNVPQAAESRGACAAGLDATVIYTGVGVKVVFGVQKVVDKSVFNPEPSQVFKVDLKMVIDKSALFTPTPTPRVTVTTTGWVS